jgi:hypothetical protein
VTNSSDMSTIVAAAVAPLRLKPREDLDDPGWTFWELRNLNMHRVVGLLKDDRAFADVRDLERAIRGAIVRHFTRAWWRGLAYGVVAEVTLASWKPDDLEPVVDIYDNRKGVLQWIVLVDRHQRRAVGAHTWVGAYLSPVYQMVLGALASDGYAVARAVKGKNGIWKFLTEVGELQGAVFPEYRDKA